MGMEVVSGASSVTKYWPALTCKTWMQAESDNEQNDDSFLSHSAPTSSTFFTDATCRRAASFPVVALAFPSSDLNVRWQSESGALNKIAVTIPKKISQEIKPIPSPKMKCRVRFADECGCELASVRVMEEPSDFPPEIPIEVLKRHRKAAGLEEIDDAPKPKSSWKVLFKQPASEYIKFRNKLETNHVALENAMIKNDVPKMIGTIKVGNISFEKRVFLRCTDDGWKTFKDYDGKFQVSASKAFDTFTFDIPLKSNVGIASSKFEFCICYKLGDGTEHWDSNDGQNYKLAGEDHVEQNLSSFQVPYNSSSEPKLLPINKAKAMYNDAYAMDFRNDWGNFGSWQKLSTDSPYW